jgi:hypothetical protein
MRTSDYRDPLRELRLAERRVSDGVTTRATRELRESVSAERSTVLLDATRSRPARRSFRAVPSERRRPSDPRFRFVPFPEPGAVRSDRPAVYAIRDAYGRTRRAGFGESLRDA